jgi:hypothetical protein
MSMIHLKKTFVFVSFFCLLAGTVLFPFSQARAQYFNPGYGQFFTTGGSVQTLPASNITVNSALLNGSVYLPFLAFPANSIFSSQSQQIQYRFSFGGDPTLTAADHTNFSFARNAGMGEGVFSNIVNLAAGTLYYYRLEVTLPNNFVIAGNILSFGTAPNQGGISAVHTLAAIVNGDRSVTLKGQINPMGSMPQYWFEYSESPFMAFSAATPYQFAANISGYIDVFQTIPNFTVGSIYYYRLAAQTAYGTMYGDVMSFWISSRAPAAQISSGSEGQGYAAVNYPDTSYSGGQPLYPRYTPIVTADYSAAQNPGASSRAAYSNSKKTAPVSNGPASAAAIQPASALPVFASTASDNSASVIGSSGSLIGSSSFLLFLGIIIAGLVAYKFFFSRKKQSEGNAVKFGTLRIID